LTYSILSDNWYVILLPPVEEEIRCRKEEIARPEGVRNSRLSSRIVGGNNRSEHDMAEVPFSRPSPPRPGDYVVVPGSQGPRRDFRISVGLREGWDAEGRVFDVSEAVRTARAWMKRRVESGQPALSGMFTRAEVTYAWPRDDGTVGSDREPVALFTGEAVHAYLGLRCGHRGHVE
jgi:hypothetical protein